MCFCAAWTEFLYIIYIIHVVQKVDRRFHFHSSRGRPLDSTAVGTNLAGFKQHFIFLQDTLFYDISIEARR
jgi:hypothetical protein